MLDPKRYNHCLCFDRWPLTNCKVNFDTRICIKEFFFFLFFFDSYRGFSLFFIDLISLGRKQPLSRCAIWKELTILFLFWTFCLLSFLVLYTLLHVKLLYLLSIDCIVFGFQYLFACLFTDTFIVTVKFWCSVRSLHTEITTRSLLSICEFSSTC